MKVPNGLRRLVLVLAALALCTAAGLSAAAPPPATVHLHVDARAAGTPFPHFWEQMFGSGRATLSLRDDYRKDLATVHQATHFEYVRFHGIFDRDVGLVQRDGNGRVSYNFSYVDQIYDGLLAHGVKPFVELGFMPPDLSSDPSRHHSFWYHPNVMPPKDYAEWDAMIRAFARHLIDRYGIDEVASWYFEVWNEPNIDFWGGEPKQATYFKLYDHTARALKSVSPRLRVGGPATAQAAWIPAFLEHVHAAHVPVDFVSSHVYGDDTAGNVFHRQEHIPRKDMVCRAVAKVHDEILVSPYPQLPLVFSEYNASYANLPNVTDTVFMGPWIANTIRACAGKVAMMSYWTFSDVFEEQGVVRTPFYGGFGLIAEDRIPKPSFNAFAMLHRLGDTRLPLDSDSALATRRADGTLVVALWNYAPPVAAGPDYVPGPPQGAVKRFELDVSHLASAATATVWRLDATHGNVIATFDRMGRPAFPGRAQIAELRAAGRGSPPQKLAVRDGRLTLDVPPQGLVVLEVRATPK
ncbi:MAG TPA: glycosyl hydrolase family 39 [Rhodanobacteraceae bacterium]|nr:glycosyl hydrolase family 39 [Rhodanobacteraceae bacterium]